MTPVYAHLRGWLYKMVACDIFTAGLRSGHCRQTPGRASHAIAFPRTARFHLRSASGPGASRCAFAHPKRSRSRGGGKAKGGNQAARKEHFSGNVQVSCVVDEKGRPTNVQISRGVGLGLDEEAVEAVRQYRFRLATRNGKPVSAPLLLEVNFQIF